MLVNLELKFMWPTYLVKYIEVEYGKNLTINANNYAFRLLVGTRNVNLKPGYIYSPGKYPTSKYTIAIPEYYFNNANIPYIKGTGANHFIHFIEGEFKKKLEIHVNAQLNLKEKIKENFNNKNKAQEALKSLTIKSFIIEFLEKFSINEEDVKVESLIKHIQRHGSYAKKPLNIGVNTSYPANVL